MLGFESACNLLILAALTNNSARKNINSKSLLNESSFSKCTGLFPVVVRIVVFEQKPCIIFAQLSPRDWNNIPIANIRVKIETTPGILGSEFHLNLLPPRRAGILKRVNGILIFASPRLVMKNNASIPVNNTISGSNNKPPSLLNTSTAILSPPSYDFIHQHLFN